MLRHARLALFFLLVACGFAQNTVHGTLSNTSADPVGVCTSGFRYNNLNLKYFKCVAQTWVEMTSAEAAALIKLTGPAGAVIEGKNDGDILLWNRSMRVWYPNSLNNVAPDILPPGSIGGNPLPLDWKSGMIASFSQPCCNNLFSPFIDTSGAANVLTLAASPHIPVGYSTYVSNFGFISVLEFDGMDDFALVAHNVLLDQLSSTTVEIGFDLVLPVVNQQTILVKNGWRFAASDSSIIWESNGVGTALSFPITKLAGPRPATCTRADSSETVRCPNLNMVTATSDGANSRLYLNGFLVASSMATLSQGTADITLGSRADGTQPYNGRFISLRVWNRALNAEAVYQATHSNLIPQPYIPPARVIDGGLLAFGAGISVEQQWPALAFAAITAFYPSAPVVALTNFSAPGRTTEEMAADAALVDPLSDGHNGNILFVSEGSNDLKSGTSAIDAYNNLATYCFARKAAGFNVVVFTLLPRSDAGIPSDFETSRQYINAHLRANASQLGISLIDVGGDITIGQAGRETDTNFYQSDHVNLNAAGHQLVSTMVVHFLRPY